MLIQQVRGGGEKHTYTETLSPPTHTHVSALVVLAPGKASIAMFGLVLDLIVGTSGYPVEGICIFASAIPRRC